MYGTMPGFGNKGSDRRGFKKGGRRGSGGSGGRSSGGFGGKPRKPSMNEVTCDECGKKCMVPFRPTGDKPVYCSDCFRNKEDSGPSSKSSSYPSKSSSYDKQFEEINKKLDKIMAALDLE